MPEIATPSAILKSSACLLVHLKPRRQEMLLEIIFDGGNARREKRHRLESYSIKMKSVRCKCKLSMIRCCGRESSICCCEAQIVQSDYGAGWHHGSGKFTRGWSLLFPQVHTVADGALVGGWFNPICGWQSSYSLINLANFHGVIQFGCHRLCSPKSDRVDVI